MDLRQQYQKQWQWRDWESLYQLLPNLENSLIYDLGCAHGDHSFSLSSLGASIIGIDGNEDLISYASKREINNVKFKLANLENIDQMNLKVADGIWMSFTAAYFTNIKEQLRKLKSLLKPNGWLAITEMDDLFGHTPLDKKWKSKIEAFYQDSFNQKRYDFLSGQHLERALIESGFEIHERTYLKDRELSGNGVCSEEIINAWSLRFDRMKGLQAYLGDDFNDFKKEFLNCLRDESHRSQCQVYFYLAKKGDNR